ncbi:DUF4922 domain-containing protein [Spartinivicinus ruber]|uniref:DUF4922 domain-containing protein n=1 Tax=Spartinivicinus ruber TaxID=2683272 RepID=UPI001CA3AFA9|nr:DUF4922 domain-containing protein [Spartinivicinus ruber]
MIRAIFMFWDQAEQVTEQALAVGSLLPIATQPSVIEEAGIQFLLHTKLKTFNKKTAVSNKKVTNPFLPFEQDMYVGEAGDSHVCLLNKFPVLLHHLLICTRRYEAQTLPLTLENFEAWLLGVTTPDVLGFYNGGEAAGASQMHRHMQLVKTEIPMVKIISSGNLAFKHQLYYFTDLKAEDLFSAYQEAMYQLGLIIDGQCLPYNILLTKQWMLILPRTKAQLNELLVNGLNYTGRFLVKNNEQAQWLRQYGFLRVLAECGQV